MANEKEIAIDQTKNGLSELYSQIIGFFDAGLDQGTIAALFAYFKIYNGLSELYSQITSSFNAGLDQSMIAARNTYFKIYNWEYASYIFPTLLVILVVALIFHTFLRKYIDWHSNWLSYLTKQRMHQILKKKNVEQRRPNLSVLNPLRILRQLFSTEPFKRINLILRYLDKSVPYDAKHFYFPSPTSLGILLLFVGIILYLSHSITPIGQLFAFDWWSNFLSYELTSAERDNVLVILSGEVAVIFSLIIFVAESVRSRKSEDEKRVLLKISNLWLLASGATLLLLSFLWGKPNVISLIFPLVLGVAIITSFWRVIVHLVVPSIQEENRIQFLKERVRRSFEFSATERLGNNILVENTGLDKRIKLELPDSRVFIEEETAGYLEVNLSGSGWLSDINLSELESIVKLLEDEAKRLGFSLYSQPRLQALDIDEVLGVQGTGEQSSLTSHPVYLLKRIGEPVNRSMFTSEDPTILLLPEEFKKAPHIVEEIEARVSRAFILNSDKPASSAFFEELKGIREQLQEAIQVSAMVQIDTLRNVYVKIAETLLESLVKYGGGYSAKQAREESNGLSSNWNEISWLRDDVRDLLVAAAKTNDAQVIRKVFYMPIAIAVRALQVKDHLLFQEFLNFAPFLYSLGRNKSDDVKSTTSDRSWRHLTETANFFIEPKLRDSARSGKIEDLENYKDFAIYCIKVFQSLMKIVLDNSDIETFRKSFKEFQKLYDRVDLGVNIHHLDYLKHTLEQTDVDKDRVRLLSEIEQTEVKINVAENLNFSKAQVTFGLSAWCLFRIREAPDSDEYLEFFEVLNEALPSNIHELTKLYGKSHTVEAESYWGWDWWEPRSDGEVYTIDVSAKLDAIFCVKALQILSPMEDVKASQLDLPHTRNLANQMSGASGGALTAMLTSIKGEDGAWNTVLEEAAFSKIDILIELLQKLKEAQEEDDIEFLKNATIDEGKLKKFKDRAIEGMKTASHLRGIFKALGILDDYNTEQPGTKIPSIGYNQIDDKAEFLTNWHVGYGDLGSAYVRGLGSSEDQVIFQKILAGVGSSETVSPHDLLSTIRKKLAENNFREPIIFQTLDSELEWDYFRNSDSFIAHWKPECPDNVLSGLSGFMGVFKDDGNEIPVVDPQTTQNRLENKIVIIEISKFGIWKQYSPVDETNDEDDRIDQFLLKVTDLNTNEALREEITTSGAQWLKGHQDLEGYLRQKVVIKFFEKFDFEIKEANAGVCIEVRADRENPIETAIDGTNQ